MPVDPRISECLRALTRATMYLSTVEDTDALTAALQASQSTVASLRSALSRRERDIDAIRDQISTAQAQTTADACAVLASHELSVHQHTLDYDASIETLQQDRAQWQAERQAFAAAAHDAETAARAVADAWAVKCTDLTATVAALEQAVAAARKEASAAKARLETMSQLLAS